MFRQIKYFQEVVKCGSFTEAAEVCHISQSAISQQIAALENEIGTKLLVRHNRKFSLTAAGEFFYNKSLILSSELEQILNETVRIANNDKIQFVIGYLRCCEIPELHDSVAEFVKLNPNITIQTESRSHEGLYKMLRSGNMDLVLSDQRRAFSDEYVNLILREGRSYVEVSLNSPLAELNSIEINELADVPCILPVAVDEQEDEKKYFRDVVGFKGDFIFSETVNEARLLVVAERGVMPIDELSPAKDYKNLPVARVPLCRNGKQIRKNYCAFWKANHSGDYVKNFAEILRNKFNS